MGHQSNYDQMLFLTSPMALTGVETHDFVFAKPTNTLTLDLYYGHTVYQL